MPKNQQIKILPRTFLIREFLRKEHLTQKQFASMCGVSQSYVSKVLSGKEDCGYLDGKGVPDADAD